jgi:signal peptidase II
VSIAPLDQVNVTLYKHSKVVGLIFAVLFLDVLTKHLTQSYLPLMYSQTAVYPYGGIAVFKNFLGVEFSITHAINHGAAWGILTHYQFSLLVFRILLVCLLIGYVLFFNKQSQQTFPLVLVIAGAMGNILDYFFYGHVVDMFYFIFWGYSYPVFNVADSAITLGVLWLLFQNWRHPISSPL